MMSVSVDALVAGPRGHACHGVGDLRGDCGAPANLHRRLRRPDEGDPQGRVLENARERDMGGILDRTRRSRRRDRHSRPPTGGEIIAWGGASLAQSLSRAGIVDEHVLFIQPVAFGSGLPMFPDLPDLEGGVVVVGCARSRGLGAALPPTRLDHARSVGSTPFFRFRPGPASRRGRGAR